MHPHDFAVFVCLVLIIFTPAQNAPSTVKESKTVILCTKWSEFGGVRLPLSFHIGEELCSFPHTNGGVNTQKVICWQNNINYLLRVQEGLLLIMHASINYLSIQLGAIHIVTNPFFSCYFSSAWHLKDFLFSLLLVHLVILDDLFLRKRSLISNNHNQVISVEKRRRLTFLLQNEAKETNSES